MMMSDRYPLIIFKWHINGVVHETSYLAAEVNKVTQPTIRNWCKSANKPNCFLKKYFLIRHDVVLCIVMIIDLGGVLFY